MLDLPYGTSTGINDLLQSIRTDHTCRTPHFVVTLHIFVPAAKYGWSCGGLASRQSWVSMKFEEWSLVMALCAFVCLHAYMDGLLVDSQVGNLYVCLKGVMNGVMVDSQVVCWLLFPPLHAGSFHG